MSITVYWYVKQQQLSLSLSLSLSLFSHVSPINKPYLFILLASDSEVRACDFKVDLTLSSQLTNGQLDSVDKLLNDQQVPLGM